MHSCSYYDEYFVAKEFDGNGTECFDMVKEELDLMWVRLEKQGAFEIWPTWPYDPCKKEICDMYMTMYNRARPYGTNFVWPGCEPIMMFNYTMCLTEYRDVDNYCSCPYR